jgi:hypothetical protein
MITALLMIMMMIIDDVDEVMTSAHHHHHHHHEYIKSHTSALLLLAIDVDIPVLLPSYASACNRFQSLLDMGYKTIDTFFMT